MVTSPSKTLKILACLFTSIWFKCRRLGVPMTSSLSSTLRGVSRRCSSVSSQNSGAWKDGGRRVYHLPISDISMSILYVPQEKILEVWPVIIFMDHFDHRSTHYCFYKTAKTGLMSLLGHARSMYLRYSRPKKYRLVTMCLTTSPDLKLGNCRV